MDEQLKDYLMRKMESEMDSVVTLDGGAAVEMVDNEIAKVVKNICDINTSMGVRKITLTLAAKPMDENRSIILWGIDVPPAKLCGQDARAVTSEVKVDANGKGFYTKQKSNPQLPMFGDTGQNVIEIGGGKE